jgi:hypothetical protein
MFLLRGRDKKDGFDRQSCAAHPEKIIGEANQTFILLLTTILRCVVQDYVAFST